MLRSALALLAAVALGSPAWADRATVVLRDGLEMRGDVELADAHLVLSNSAGQAIIKRTSVQDIRWDTPPADLEAEFRRRAFVIADDDLDTRIALGEWAWHNERRDWAESLCNAVLRADARHAAALALRARLTGEPPPSASSPAVREPSGNRPRAAEPRDPATQDPRDPAPPDCLEAPRLLDPGDVNLLRLAEIDPDGPAPEVSVRFNRRRGQKDVDELVLERLKARPDADPAVLRVLERGKAHERLQIILRETELEFADRIEVRGDAPALATFRRNVLPLISRGCGPSGCHAGEAARVFRLPPGSLSNERVAYTAFVLLNEMQTPIGPMIDRAVPEQSALLQYLSPAVADQPHPHPEVKRERFRPLLRGPRDRRYQDIAEWIAQLRVPRPEYPLKLDRPPWWRALTTAAEPGANAADARPPTLSRPTERP